MKFHLSLREREEDGTGFTRLLETALAALFLCSTTDPVHPMLSGAASLTISDHFRCQEQAA
jgi:hypothetical protein